MESLGQCLEYVKGTLTIPVSLPKGHEGCKYCAFLVKDRDIGFYKCSRTEEPILDITNTRGDRCPVDWED